MLTNKLLNEVPVKKHCISLVIFANHFNIFHLNVNTFQQNAHVRFSCPTDLRKVFSIQILKWLQILQFHQLTLAESVKSHSTFVPNTHNPTTRSYPVKCTHHQNKILFSNQELN